jgi:hypothetical protein
MLHWLNQHPGTQPNSQGTRQIVPDTQQMVADSDDELSGCTRQPHLPSTQRVLMNIGTRGTTPIGLRQKEQERPP